MSWQPTDVDDLSAAIREFETALPGWWWSVCACSISRDASCGPDVHGPDAHLLSLEDRTFDKGFHHDDHEGTLANSLREVMRLALRAKEDYQRLQESVDLGREILDLLERDHEFKTTGSPSVGTMTNVRERLAKHRRNRHE